MLDVNRILRRYTRLFMVFFCIALPGMAVLAISLNGGIPANEVVPLFLRVLLGAAFISLCVVATIEISISLLNRVE